VKNKGVVVQGADGEEDGVDHEELTEITAKDEVRRGGGERRYEEHGREEDRRAKRRMGED
jgi:hypothetical protein